jgi:hypothetical protein
MMPAQHQTPSGFAKENGDASDVVTRRILDLAVTQDSKKRKQPVRIQRQLFGAVLGDVGYETKPRRTFSRIQALPHDGDRGRLWCQMTRGWKRLQSPIDVAVVNEVALGASAASVKHDL